MLKSTGIPTQKDLESVVPSKERLAKGPVAIMECFERYRAIRAIHPAKGVQ